MTRRRGLRPWSVGWAPSGRGPSGARPSGQGRWPRRRGAARIGGSGLRARARPRAPPRRLARAATRGARAARDAQPPAQVVARAHLQPPLGGDRHRRAAAAARSPRPRSRPASAPSRRGCATRRRPPGRPCARTAAPAVTTPAGVHAATAVGATAVHAPAGERHARLVVERRLPPPPVLGERGAPVLLRVHARAVERALAEATRDVRAEQVRRPVLPEPGHGAGGAERAPRPPRPVARRGEAREEPRAELDVSDVRVGAQVRRALHAEPVRIDPARRRRRPCARTPPGSAASVIIAQVPRSSRQTPAITATLQSGAGEAPVVALERPMPWAGRGSPKGRRRPCAGRRGQREIRAWVTGTFQRVSASASDSSSR